MKGDGNIKARQIARQQKLDERQVFLNQFKKGEVSGGKRWITPRLRNFLLEEANYACTKCGYKGLNGNGRPNLEITHKNNNPYDHYYDNLQVLCRNCHGEVTVYTSPHISKGTGRGRSQNYPSMDEIQPRLTEVEQQRWGD